MVSLSEKAEQIRQRELRRAMGKLPDLKEEERRVIVMKKILERMAQIAYSINLVNGFDTEVEVFACAENC